jgi:hypothetical protein
MAGNYVFGIKLRNIPPNKIADKKMSKEAQKKKCCLNAVSSFLLASLTKFFGNFM